MDEICSINIVFHQVHGLDDYVILHTGHNTPWQSAPHKGYFTITILVLFLQAPCEFPPFFSVLWYISGMFNVTKEVLGENGEFVRLVQLDSEDFWR